jgi:hypothetical protein
MKRQWRIRRHFRLAADGAQRWDQAYQHLLEWRPVSTASNARSPVTRASPTQEEAHEHGDLCSGVD